MNVVVPPVLHRMQITQNSRDISNETQDLFYMNWVHKHPVTVQSEGFVQDPLLKSNNLGVLTLPRREMDPK